MIATYGKVTERPIGLPLVETRGEDREEEGEDEGASFPTSSLSLSLNVLSPQVGTAIGIRGVGVGPLAQLLSQYCSDLCTDQRLALQADALIETCARHRQYQHTCNQESQRT
jgi:hypothetical protein